MLLAAARELIIMMVSPCEGKIYTKMKTKEQRQKLTSLMHSLFTAIISLIEIDKINSILLGFNLHNT